MEWIIYLLVIILIFLIWFNLKKSDDLEDRSRNPFHQRQKERFSELSFLYELT
jgi:hypothetical protein